MKKKDKKDKKDEKDERGKRNWASLQACMLR
jgi:hypothetical protein